MSALDAVDELISLVRLNSDIAHHAGGCPPEVLRLAEAQLGLRFPPSYRRFVAEFGTCDIAGEEFLGVYRTDAMGDQLLGSVRETVNARGRWGLPAAMLVAMFDGMGGLIVLNTAVKNSEDESPVLVWTPAGNESGNTEQLAQDFGRYALGLCKSAVQRWRESE